MASQHVDSSSNADLVAHFFRRSFDLLREGAPFGLVATNTIAQGDTRASGLRWICSNRGEIFAAKRRVRWPGVAAVVVSVVHVIKGHFAGVRELDGRVVKAITAFLFHMGSHNDPVRLAANDKQSFVGLFLRGMGFTFDDSETKGIASPIVEMERILAAHEESREVVFPYIGGEEVNTSPTHAHHRFVINFGDRDENECRRRWPHLMKIVEARVRPERARLGDSSIDRAHKQRWWSFANTRPELRTAIARMERVLVCAIISNKVQFAFLPNGMVYSHKLVVFPYDRYAPFCILQSNVHEIWVRCFSSSMKDDINYSPSDCFETFPFPPEYESSTDLERIGGEYYRFRADLMVQHNEGLTKTYNRFHDPDEQHPDILRLRELHAAMDRAVLDAYGWTDLQPTCEFLLDYEDEEGEQAGKASTKKKPWRYRWPDEFRDEVLGRLLALNAERAQSR